MSAPSTEPVRSRPTRGKTSRTWKAWTGTPPASGLPASQRQPSGRTRRPEAGLERLAEPSRADPVEQRVPEPVRLDDASIERVGEPVGASDQLEIRPGALERAGQLAQGSIVVAGRDLAEQLVDRVRAAVAEPVRTEGIAREQDGTRWREPTPPRRGSGRRGTGRREWRGDRCDGPRDGRCRAHGQLVGAAAATAARAAGPGRGRVWFARSVEELLELGRFGDGEPVDDRAGGDGDPLADGDVGEEQGRGSAVSAVRVDHGARRVDPDDLARE